MNTNGKEAVQERKLTRADMRWKLDNQGRTIGIVAGHIIVVIAPSQVYIFTMHIMGKYWGFYPSMKGAKAAAEDHWAQWLAFAGLMEEPKLSAIEVIKETCKENKFCSTCPLKGEGVMSCSLTAPVPCNMDIDKINAVIIAQRTRIEGVDNGNNKD